MHKFHSIKTIYRNDSILDQILHIHVGNKYAKFQHSKCKWFTVILHRRRHAFTKTRSPENSKKPIWKIYILPLTCLMASRFIHNTFHSCHLINKALFYCPQCLSPFFDTFCAFQSRSRESRLVFFHAIIILKSVNYPQISQFV